MMDKSEIGPPSCSLLGRLRDRDRSYGSSSLSARLSIGRAGRGFSTPVCAAEGDCARPSVASERRRGLRLISDLTS